MPQIYNGVNHARRQVARSVRAHLGVRKLGEPEDTGYPQYGQHGHDEQEPPRHDRDVQQVVVQLRELLVRTPSQRSRSRPTDAAANSREKREEERSPCSWARPRPRTRGATRSRCASRTARTRARTCASPRGGPSCRSGPAPPQSRRSRSGPASASAPLPRSLLLFRHRRRWGTSVRARRRTGGTPGAWSPRRSGRGARRRRRSRSRSSPGRSARWRRAAAAAGGSPCSGASGRRERARRCRMSLCARAGRRTERPQTWCRLSSSGIWVCVVCSK
ncbi:hypothetical protein C8Q79DRAFT_697700 [Trametes meyenii]|nr:hypothetical protein C8Q79DRAFT_697700 [Trametes meyenii]